MNADREVLDVVYDITPLDEIDTQGFTRTGVFRVVEQMALQLARSASCRLSFSCSRDFIDAAGVLDKVARVHPALAGRPVRQLWRVSAAFADLERRVERVRKRAGESVLAKVRRAGLLWRMARTPPVAFDAAALPRHAIFHSPWAALPPLEPCRARGVVRALTVYDMTPRLFPHFFEDTGFFETTMRSITPGDHVLAISECTKGDFCALTRHDPARVHVTPLAADPATFQRVDDAAVLTASRAKYHIPEGRYLLSVNTLQPRKNLEQCIRSFTRLVQAEKLDDLSLVLVGDRGWKTGEISAALRGAGGLAERIVLTGYVPAQDLSALYSGALAFVYVSHYEGFGLPPLEAMQCGVPVIAADNSSLPEVVGDAGILVPATDGDALCDAMRSLYRDATLRASYAARALARARQFSWDRCADLTVAAYRRMQAS